MNIIEKLGITQGPWYWRVNKSARHINLFSDRGSLVMDFARYGMQDAQPRFAIEGRMVKAEKLSIEIEGQEHNKSWYKTISTPDSRVIETAPEMLDELIKEWQFIESYLGSNASRNDVLWYNEFVRRQDSIKNKILKATKKSWEEIKELIG